MTGRRASEYKQGAVVSGPWGTLHCPPRHRYKVHNLHPRLGPPPLPPALLPDRLTAAPHAPTSADHHIATYCTAGEKEEREGGGGTKRTVLECNGPLRRLEILKTQNRK